MFLSSKIERNGQLCDSANVALCPGDRFIGPVDLCLQHISPFLGDMTRQSLEQAFSGNDREQKP
jgi:hypothetical protein